MCAKHFNLYCVVSDKRMGSKMRMGYKMCKNFGLMHGCTFSGLFLKSVF